MDITMPQLGETVTEGTITRWLKHVGDRVDVDEPLFEVSTDKVDSEVPAPTAGFLTEIRVPEGETAGVGAVLAVLGDAPAAGRAPGAAAGPATRPEPVVPPAPPPTAPPIPASAPATTPRPPVAPSPPPAPPAPPSSAPAPPPAPPTSRPPTPVAPATSAAALPSPVVRRLIAEHNLDASQIRGTGDGGRITRKDALDAAAARRGAAGPATARPPIPVPSAPAAPAPPAPPEPPLSPPPEPAAARSPIDAPGSAVPTEIPAPAAPPSNVPPPAATAAPGGEPAPRPAQGDEVVAFSNMRRRTAEHMVRSKATSAHVYTSVEVDYERVASVRERHQKSWRAREGFPLTYLPFVARAFGDAVGEFPYINASVVDESLVVHRDVHLAIAVDLDLEGLVAPVIRNADGKRLRLLAREIRDLAERARTRQLTPDEVLGGTFTITNPGPFGTYITLPIINQPQVAVLSTDGVRKRPAVVPGPDGADFIAVRHIGILALAWDHRAFDGAYAASFLRALKEDLETRDWEAELA